MVDFEDVDFDLSVFAFLTFFAEDVEEELDLLFLLSLLLLLPLQLPVLVGFELELFA